MVMEENVYFVQKNVKIVPMIQCVLVVFLIKLSLKMENVKIFVKMVSI